jgi:26S proteasome regulatory subunit N4
VDSEGFPRGDIDIYQIRTMRNKLCCLQTDHKRLMSRIEEGLYSLHSTYMKDSEKEESKEKIKTKEKVFRRGEGSAPIPVGEGECLQIPFVWVAKVDHNSPAQEAGSFSLFLLSYE